MSDTDGTLEQAVAALQIYLANPTDAGAGRVAAMALYRQGRWDLAANVWGRMAEQGLTRLEDLVLYGCCLVRCGALDQARALAAALPNLTAGMTDEQRATLTPFADTHYANVVVEAFNAGAEHADLLLDLMLPHEPFGRRMLGLAPLADDGVARPDRLEDSAVAEFIRGRIAEAQAGRALPPWARVPYADAARAAARYRGMKVLIVYRERYWPTPKSERHPAGDLWAMSAAQIGLDVRQVRSDCACLEGPESQMAAELADLERAICEWRPQLVVYDQFGGPGREPFTRLMGDLRAEMGFKLISLYSDTWHSKWGNAFAEAAQYVDAAWFMDASLPDAAIRAVPNAVGTLPPFSEAPFAAAQARMPRTIGLGFAGSCSIGNYVRGLWILEARRRGVAMEAVTGYPVDTRYQGIDGFADFMASCKVSLCICGRNITQSALPGRVWEGIFSNSVLLADDCPDLREVLIPFAHYVPFRTVDELAFYAGFLERNEDVRQAIAEAALAFVREYYSPEAAWSQVLAMAFGQGAGSR